MVLFFYLFASLALLSGIGVITARNPVYAVLFLIFMFCNVAGILVLSGAEFLAFLIVISYAGAVAMLFLFVVMMLDIKSKSLSFSGGNISTYIAIIIICAFISNLIIVIYSGFKSYLFPRSYSANTINNVRSIGMSLYTDYILPFQMSGVILLIAMIGCIMLTIRKKNGIKQQNAFIQLSRKREDSIAIINVAVGKGVEDERNN